MAFEYWIIAGLYVLGAVMTNDIIELIPESGCRKISPAQSRYLAAVWPVISIVRLAQIISILWRRK